MPALVEPYKEGTVLVNYDVTEVTVVSEEDETRKDYLYTSVEIPTPIDYSTLVSTMIRERYSADEENAIVRKMIAIDNLDNDIDKEKVREEFRAYNDYAEQCKVKAKAVIEECFTI